MSATGRGTLRVTNDQYPTPPWCVDRLMECLYPAPRSLEDKGLWCEPCCGDGNIVKTINRYFRKHGVGLPEWQLYDIDEKYREVMASISDTFSVLNFTLLNEFAEKPFDVTITNPPYDIAQEIAETSFRTAHETYLFLRINFLGSQERHPFFRTYGTPDIFVMPNRPPFLGRTTDATEYAWFRWDEEILRQGRPGQVHVLNLTPALVVKHTFRPPAPPKARKMTDAELREQMISGYLDPPDED